jgi:tetratricopeptide (TPR) repeat protein
MRKIFSILKPLILMLCAFCLPNQSFGEAFGDHVFQIDIGFPGMDLNGINCPQPTYSLKLRDYTDPWWYKQPYTGSNIFLRNVEKFHFTPSVEFLTAGKSSGTIYGDLYYTLDKFPNHYRALYSVSLYYVWKVYITKDKRENLIDGKDRMVPAECFFNRAIAFRKKDPKLYYLYGVYLYKLGKLDLALEQFKTSEKLNSKDSYLIPYMAQLYYDKGDYKSAAAYVKKAPKQTTSIKKLTKMLADKKISLDSN